MRANTKAKFLVTLAVALATGASVEARTWTEAATGRTVDGDFRKLNGTDVEILRPNGTLLKLPLERLSEADKAFIAEQPKAPAASPDAPAARPKVTHDKGNPLEEGHVIDLSFRSVNSGKVDLAAMQGKVVLLDFWATWCKPCVAEIPTVKEAYRAYQEKGFEIVGISLDSSEGALKDFIKENGMTWPQYFDGKGWDNELAQHYGVRSIPAVYLVKDNKVIATGVRGSRLESELKKLLD